VSAGAQRMLLNLIVLGLAVCACWWWMMIVHELGHVVHGAVSGGRIERVVVPLVGFSRTDLSRNPHPVFVAWGGFVWGVGLPVVGWAACAIIKARVRLGLECFAVFCLIANGAYMATALGSPVGDVEDIVSAGGTSWPLTVGGLSAMLAGLALLLGRLRRAAVGGLRFTRFAGLWWGTAAGLAGVVSMVLAAL
jgi:hypothetical protein